MNRFIFQQNPIFFVFYFFRKMLKICIFRVVFGLVISGSGRGVVWQWKRSCISGKKLNPIVGDVD